MPTSNLAYSVAIRRTVDEVKGSGQGAASFFVFRKCQERLAMADGLQKIRSALERAKGIEPSYAAWEAKLSC